MLAMSNEWIDSRERYFNLWAVLYELYKHKTDFPILWNGLFSDESGTLKPEYTIIKKGTAYHITKDPYRQGLLIESLDKFSPSEILASFTEHDLQSAYEIDVSQEGVKSNLHYLLNFELWETKRALT